MSAKITALREERGQLATQYQQLRDKYKDKKSLRDWETSDQTLNTELHERIADLDEQIDVELSNEREAQLSEPRENRAFVPVVGVTERSQEEMDLRGAFIKALFGAERSMTPGETRAFQTELLDQGGYLNMPQTMYGQILKNVDNDLIIRQLAEVVPNVGPEGLGAVTMDTDLEDASWGTEIGETPEGTALRLGKRELKPVEDEILVKASEKLLGNPGAEGFIMQRVAYKAGVKMEKAFMTGTGINQPLGVFTAHADGISTSRDVTGGTSGTIKGDDLINMVHELKAPYRRNAAWVLHRLILKIVRKLKDDNGQYIWTPDGGIGQAAVYGHPATILGMPYFESEYAPTSTSAGEYGIVLGDFKKYMIADGAFARVKRLNELYARTKQIGFQLVASVDGQPVLEEAFARFKFS